MDLGKLEYTKRPARLEPGIVFVLSGGEEREEVFLRPLMEKDFFRQCVHVLFQSREGQGLMPDKMEELWQSARKRKKIMYNGRDYRISSIDKVFLVSDVDEFEPVLVKILSNKDALDKAQWIISNPCFEIWLYYCYRSDIDPEVKRLRYIRRSKRSQKMKQLNNQLIRGGTDPRKAFDKALDGIANSKSHFRAGHYGIPGLFATSMHEMMEQIFDFLNQRGQSFADYQRQKKEDLKIFLAARGISI